MQSREFQPKAVVRYTALITALILETVITRGTPPQASQRESGAAAMCMTAALPSRGHAWAWIPACAGTTVVEGCPELLRSCKFIYLASNLLNASPTYNF